MNVNVLSISINKVSLLLLYQIKDNEFTVLALLPQTVDKLIKLITFIFSALIHVQ